MPRPPRPKLPPARALSSHALSASLHATSSPTRAHPRDPPPRSPNFNASLHATSSPTRTHPRDPPPRSPNFNASLHATSRPTRIHPRDPPPRSPNFNAALHATSPPTRTHPRDPPPPHQLHPPRHRSPACSPQLARGPMIRLHCPHTPRLTCPCARHCRRHHVVPVPNSPPLLERPPSGS